MDKLWIICGYGWCFGSPLKKIRVRQLGWWNTQLNGKMKNVPNHQPVMNSETWIPVVTLLRLQRRRGMTCNGPSWRSSSGWQLAGLVQRFEPHTAENSKFGRLLTEVPVKKEMYQSIIWDETCPTCPLFRIDWEIDHPSKLWSFMYQCKLLVRITATSSNYHVC